ncbi:MAG: hypothetical protein QOI83_3140 [Streptomycetaceae bacterium]|nr:hypothetical protein [Streptomycetaceae bacterium]
MAQLLYPHHHRTRLQVLLGDGLAFEGAGDGDAEVLPEADADAPPEEAEVAETGTGEAWTAPEAVAVPLAEALAEFFGLGLPDALAEASDADIGLSLPALPLRPPLVPPAVAGCDVAASEEAVSPE